MQQLKAIFSQWLPALDLLHLMTQRFNFLPNTPLKFYV